MTSGLIGEYSTTATNPPFMRTVAYLIMANGTMQTNELEHFREIIFSNELCSDTDLRDKGADRLVASASVC